ncbi:MAG: hypothetical protein AAF389_05630 [Gemmatimonadota bacterium]
MVRRLFTRLLLSVCVFVVLGITPGAAQGQTALRISGQLDLAAAESDRLGVNRAFRGDSPFNPVRLRLFAQKWVTPRIGVFSEILYDSSSGIRVNGAYAVINEIGGETWLNGRFGLAPNPVGAFGLRSTYFNANPLIGLPLAWQYRTNLVGEGTSTFASLTGAAAGPGGGVPLLYDACWNIQWELLGEAGIFEYSFALTPGSLSNPAKSADVEGQSWMARVGLTPAAGLRVGVSASEGPFLSAPTPDENGDLPYTAETNSFDQSLLGVDVEFLRGPFAIHAEVHASRWETPLVDDALDLTSGFVEVRYDISPRWYAAGRVGTMRFGEIAPNGGGNALPWDADLNRTEFALGYRASRGVLIKADWQRTRTVGTGFTQNLFATQLSTVF